MSTLTRSRGIWLLGLLAGPVLCLSAIAAPLTGTDLVTALRAGGYVLLMRHAQSPNAPPDATQADRDNRRHERQLDQTGRDSARAMGDALRRLRIPVGKVLSSPTYRALESARMAQLPSPQTAAALSDAGKSMSPDLPASQTRWLRAHVAQPPKAGTDTVIITQGPNIAQAFANDASGLSAGEALVYRPDKHGAASLVGRVKIEEWPELASAQ